MSINVAIFFGGESVEHEISIITANQALHALNKETYQVMPVYVAKNRQLYTGEELYDLANYKDLNSLVSKLKQITIYKVDNQVHIYPVKRNLFQHKPLFTIDVAFPIMHGTNGEDGTIQGFLEMLKIPYVGCDVIAASAGQDKVIMKHVFENSNLPVIPWFWLYGHHYMKDEIYYNQKAMDLGFPVIVKPASLGSSVGIEFAYDKESLKQAILNASKYDSKLVIEKALSDFKEINCSVLGNRYEAQSSELELIVQDGFLDYDGKYGQGSKGMVAAKRIVPAPLNENESKYIKDLALDTFMALGASGVCRIDFMKDEVTKQIYVNEINTIPGSLAYYLWSPVGLSFEQLLEKLIHIAIDNYRAKEKMTFSFETNVLANFDGKGIKGSKGIKQ
ncbi:MAG: D-alanine--D-alanine ligase family protein [Erysipelotrichaceae bacterium]|nr:D-alanine--D-alanine ligase family protein [Erysipelotrichaceae bacterium]